MSLNYLVKSCLFLCMSLISFNLFGNFSEETSCFSCPSQGWSTEFRVAYFIPKSKRVKKIYSKNLVDYQLELSKEIYPNYSVWLDVDYLTKKGHSQPFHDSTRICLVPIGLGLNYRFWCCNGWSAYAGAGANYTYLNIHDHSDYVKEHTSKWDFGGTLKLGIKKVFCNGITLDFFCDYFLQKFHFSKHSKCSSSEHYSSCYIEHTDLNANGLKVGIGIGYFF